mmetsp:Transcript_26888/g.78333  ORF Transcript_26888/g.78333 Transcript_26888/m.78333 type:complete len:219 (+) Transcript_26888:130-786(+)
MRAGLIGIAAAAVAVLIMRLRRRRCSSQPPVRAVSVRAEPATRVAAAETPHRPVTPAVEFAALPQLHSDGLRRGSRTRSARRSSASSGSVPLVVVSDAGQDLDDEMAIVMMRHLISRGLAKQRQAPPLSHGWRVASPLARANRWTCEGSSPPSRPRTSARASSAARSTCSACTMCPSESDRTAAARATRRTRSTRRICRQSTPRRRLRWSQAPSSSGG